MGNSHKKHLVWNQWLNENQTLIYRLCRQLNENHNMQFSWILFVKQIFNECGFSNIWETELFDNVDYLKCVIKQRLEDQFLQNWNSLVHNSPKAINYKTFKTI